MNTFTKVALGTATAVVAFGTFGALVGPSDAMIADNKADIDRCIELKGDTDACDRIKTLSGYVLDGYQPTIDIAMALRKDALQQAEVLKQAQAAELAEARKKADAALAKQVADRKAAAAKAEADFKAEGWFELSEGIYGRWCTNACSNASVIGNASYWLMEVWAKDRAAGDIYARVNILQDGVVVGWTNETAYLSKGQRGVLTFSKYLPGYGSSYSAQLTEFNARG